jgi:peptidyl-prolyl cis-trans isomerase SurA
MMKIKLTILLGVLVTLTSLVPAQQIFDGTAAIVGDEVVLISDINALITSYAIQNKIDITRQPDLYKKLGNQFLERLIDQKLLLIKADEDTIEADDERVEQSLKQQIDYMIQQAGSENKLEEYYSSPLYKIKSDMRKEISNQMRIGILREKKFMSLKISRKEVEDFYNTYKDSLPNMKSSVDISHILMQITPSEKSIEEAFLKISQLKERLDNGENFADLASQFSEDPGSAKSGGELGFVSRGTLVKEFEETAFSLEEGEISEIVQTQFGFHIIQLLERQGERINVRHILIQLQPTPQDEIVVIEKLNIIKNTIETTDSTFEDLALQYSADPNVQQDRGRLGVFEEGGFQIEEFENAIQDLNIGEISSPFKTDFGYHIVKLNNRQDARQFSLSEDWEKIEQWALQDKREKDFNNWLAELRQEIPVVVKVEL